MFVGSRRALAGRAFTFANTEAAAVVAAFTGATPDAHKARIDTLIGAWKTSGVWDELDRFFTAIAPDEQASTINWKNPSGSAAVFVNSPTFLAYRYWAGNGSSSRVRTNFTPSTDGVNYTLDDASAFLWVGDNVSENAIDLGNATEPRCNINTRLVGDTQQFRINNASAVQLGIASVTDSRGLWQARRKAASGADSLQAYKNGSLWGTANVASSALPTQEQWICGGNATSFSTKQIRCAGWGSGMVGLESALYTPLLAFMRDAGAEA
jgi:hypothetical protein